MSNDDSGIQPLQEARKKIEAAIETHLGKVAALRKRSEALSAAINVLRSSDEDLIDAPIPTRTGVKRVVEFNVQAVENSVLSLLAQGAQSYPEIEYQLKSEGHEFSRAGLRRILKTSPQIHVRGERESTRYYI